MEILVDVQSGRDWIRDVDASSDLFLAGAWMTLVTISHLVPIAMTYELVLGYVDANASTQASLAVTSDTLAMICLTVTRR